MRTCIRCKQTKPADTKHFYKSEWNGGLRQPCIECYRVEHADRPKGWTPEQRAANQHRQRRHSLQANHGLTFEEFHWLFEQQEGLCGVCSKLMCNCPGLKCQTKAVVDHDHTKTGRESVRGLVCNPCNKGMGFLRDDPHLFRNAAVYLDTPLRLGGA